MRIFVTGATGFVDFRVNFIGTVSVTQAMLPLLRKTPSARIVNVSSGLAWAFGL